MFESTWYRCSKLAGDLAQDYPTPADMERAALPHVLFKLGLKCGGGGPWGEGRGGVAGQPAPGCFPVAHRKTSKTTRLRPRRS
jgi:hypothetical protein